MYALVWGPWMLVLFMTIGLYFTIKTGFFQFTFFKRWIREPFAAFSEKKDSNTDPKEKNSISPFQALCTALAATVGTGNIAGTATALVAGGPGSVFWMCASALIGMMTTYAENLLGMKYRYQNERGEWVGGAFITMERGLHAKCMAKVYAFLCILVSFSMGNMVQIHSISDTLHASFSIPPLFTGILLSLLIAGITAGGIKRVGQVAEHLIPFASVLYIVFCSYAVFLHYEQIPSTLLLIVREAFQIPAITGACLGYGVKKSMQFGISRGIFSNEAGLGTSVLAHTSCSEQEPVQIGMWGIFEVFADTVVVCTLTALVILTSPVYEKDRYLLNALLGREKLNLNGVPLATASFSTVYGHFADYFISFSILLFATATLLAWSYYGEKTTNYLFGRKGIRIYKFLFPVIIVIGSVISLEFVWEFADFLNGLLALPNLLTILLLSKEVFTMTDQYKKRFAKSK